MVYIQSYKGHADIVKTLVASGADVNAKGENGDTALEFAARNGHTTTNNCTTL